MEGDGAITTPGYVGDISIHSLRMEGDSRHCACGRSQLHFNPLPPHGGRQPFAIQFSDVMTFQSTPSAWRETPFFRPTTIGTSHFNPLPPHGGRRFSFVRIPTTIAFQSTPSAWRETGTLVAKKSTIAYFNPLPPHGGRLFFRFYDDTIPHISIHSLRMEGDRTANFPREGE